MKTRKMMNRIISLILTLVLCMQVLPLTAFAALIDNDPAYNQVILDALTELVGSEDEATRYYALLDQYGLLDEEGNLSQSWEIWMDGRRVTLDEIIALLETPGCDMNKYVLVDGTAITLGNIKTILEIEKYIAYLKGTYYNGHQWTAEQQTNLMSLMRQIEAEGIQLSSVPAGIIVGGSGFSHSARVTLAASTADTDAEGTIVATLTNAAPNQAVSFDWTAIPGNLSASGSGTVTMTADANGEATAVFSATLGKPDASVHSSAALSWFVKLDNLTGALFANGRANTVYQGSAAATETAETMDGVKAAANGSSKTYTDTAGAGSMSHTIKFEGAAYTAKSWGMLDTATLSNYQLGGEQGSNGAWDARLFSAQSTSTNGCVDNAQYALVSGNISAKAEKVWAFNESMKDTYSGNNGYQQIRYTITTQTANISTLGADASFTLTGTATKAKYTTYEYTRSGNTIPQTCFYPTVENGGSGFLDASHKLTCTVTFSDTKAPTFQSVTAPAGTYYPGQVVPVTVTFSEPVNAATAKATINGTVCTPAETSGYSNVLTFLYSVKDLEGTELRIASVTATDLTNHTLTGYNPGGNVAAGAQISGVTIQTPVESDAIKTITAAISGDRTPVLNVTVTFNNNQAYTTWVDGNELAPLDNGKFQTTKLKVAIDNTTKHPLITTNSSITGSTMTATIPLTPNTGMSTLTHVVELYLGDKLFLDKYATADQLPVKYITAADLAPVINLGGYTFDNAENPIIYVNSTMPTLTASIGLIGTGFTYADTTDFVWESTNPNVATIDADGTIHPKGIAGTTQIKLTALNGGVPGKAVTVTATYTVGGAKKDTLEFASGLTPFLAIPQNQIRVVSGKAATVYWTSNLCDKNGATPTVFNITVTNKATDSQVHSATLSGTATNPVGSVTLSKLDYNYTADTENANTYDVTVSAVYEGKLYTATATIIVEAETAEVSVGPLDSYYILDTAGTVTIPWSVEHLSNVGSAAQDQIFRFQVTRNDAVVDTSAVQLVLDGNGHASGNFVLPITDFAVTNNPAGYREVYTVTIQAKNGIHSTWSYDSFMLYVYDADALKIWVDDAKGVLGDAGDTHTMSNVATIAKLAETDAGKQTIIEMQRDIYLKNIISVNYGEYAWTEVADQIAWHSSDSTTASINYQQGTLYENIENFTYVSYRPTTEFGLSGLKDTEGKTVTITAQHKLIPGLNDTLTLTVETLKDKLYLFQCYPQTTTTLRYQDSTGVWKTATSDVNGAAVIFEPNGIHSDVYCESIVETQRPNAPAESPKEQIRYFGTFYRDALESGEGDWTKLERYPCNNLTMRRAAYAYLYIKNPDGSPYTGKITFRGGVYMNGVYLPGAKFGLNDSTAARDGDADDNVIDLGNDGKLTVYMDQTQWVPGGTVTAQDDVSYVFEIAPTESLAYYPMLLTIDANVNIDTFVGDGSAIVNFRENPESGKHPFVAAQSSVYTGNTASSDLLGSTGNVGPTENFPETVLTTSVMWWGETFTEDELTQSPPKLQLFTDKYGKPLATEAGQYTLVNRSYPFTSSVTTEYTVKLNSTTMAGVSVGMGESSGLYLDYYRDGKTLSRHEAVSFRLINLLGLEQVQNADSITEMLTTMGKASDTKDKKTMDFGDAFVSIAMSLVASDSYSTAENNFFSIQLAPTSDPTKFLGFIEVNVGNIRDKQQVTGIYAPGSQSGAEDIDKTPGLSELMLIAGKRSMESYLTDDFNRSMNHQGVRNLKAQLGGYAESLIYYSEITGKWEIQVLNGGFNLGGGVTYSWNWNWMAGPVPITVSLEIGGTMEVGMDALSVSYYNADLDESFVGNDFLTQLRVFLYLKFFAGIGFDYAVVALKLGIYGQISLDMQFQWLNRPYMDTQDDIYNIADGTHNVPTREPIYGIVPDGTGQFPIVGWHDWEGANSKLNGQHFKIDGQIGLELVVRFLFFSFEKILFSYSFNLLDESTGQWETIQTNWEKNKAAQMSAISSLLGRKALTVNNVGGQQLLSLNLAPTLESRDYLQNGSFWNDGSFATFALDDTNALQSLQYNSYPYANPVVTDDGAIVAYLSDMGSEDVQDTRAAYAVRNGFGSYTEGSPIDDGGYGDSQIAIAGTGNFAVAAWTRQTAKIDTEPEKIDPVTGEQILTTEDQMIMMNSAEIYAAVYRNGQWATTRLTTNGTADLAPVVAANGSRAIVAWRSVASSGTQTPDGYADVTNFNEKDTILYRIYNGTGWSETYTLYNGTSGAVKGITAAMLSDGTAAVAYTLDINSNDSKLTDYEIFYAVIDTSNEVRRNVRATNDAYLDENPQLAVVTFPGANAERFVLGWYTEQAVSSDSAAALDGGENATIGETVADIRLLDFNEKGIYTQLLPDSISQATTAYDVSITSNFRFTKNVASINDLSILWVERAGGEIAEEADGTPKDGYASSPVNVSAEKDVLKGVKFYTYGQHNELVTFTGAIDVAEMGDGTVIDHFDAYVSDPTQNEIKAVILGTEYGADGVVTKTGTTISGETVQYAVPSRTTSMYTATETYQDKIEVIALLVDYETVRKGAKTEIMFAVKNNGIHAINALTITLADELGGSYVTEHTGLNLLPGTSIQLYADYTVPATKVVDPTYLIQAVFDPSTGATGGAQTTLTTTYRFRTTTQDLTSTQDKVYLDLPDVEITDAAIIREENGQREILVKLNNASDADLYGSNRFVRLSFYSDATCEKKISSLPPIDIISNEDLAMIDEGGYSISTVFDIKQHLESMKDTALTEIPESGIQVFVKAEVLEGAEVLPEPIMSNNVASVVCENLKARTGTDVILTSTLSKHEGVSTVHVTVQNTSLTQTTTGNLIVTLLDQAGNILAQQQRYNPVPELGDYGMVTLAGEEKKTEIFTFTGEAAEKAVSAAVVYSDLQLSKAEALAGDFTYTPPADLTYSGTAKAATVTGKPHFGMITIGYYADSSLTQTVDPINAGTYYVGITMKANEYYQGITKPLYVGSFTISKKAYDEPAAVERTFLRTLPSETTIELAELLPNDPGIVTYTIDSGNYTVLENVSLADSGVLTFKTKRSDTAVTDSITVKAVMQNYVDVTLTVNVILNDKTPLTITGVSAVPDLVYTGTAQQGYVGTPESDVYTGAYEITYTGRGNSYHDSAAPTNAGDYTVTFKIPDSNDYYSGNVSINFTIAKAKVTITAESKQTEAGEQMPQLTYKAVGLIGDDTLDVTLTCNADMTLAGEYPIVVSVSDQSGNYAITTVNGVLAVAKHVHIGGIEWKYDDQNHWRECACGEPTDVGAHTLDRNGVCTVCGYQAPNSGLDDTLWLLVLMKLYNQEFDIIADASEGGTITPAGITKVKYSRDQAYIITPDEGYVIQDVLVDGESVGAVEVYSFDNVRKAHSITAVFAEIPWTNPFTDVRETDVYYDDIQYVCQNGLMFGTNAEGTIFSPDQTLTRAMLVTSLWCADGQHVVDSPVDFFDVPADQGYSKAIAWASANGIVLGSGDGTFGPNAPITREQLAAILYRYEQYLDGGFSGTWMFPLQYDDAADVADWAYEAICWLTMKNIYVIREDGQLDPKEDATRAEAAAFLRRFCQYQEEKND